MEGEDVFSRSVLDRPFGATQQLLASPSASFNIEAHTELAKEQEKIAAKTVGRLSNAEVASRRSKGKKERKKDIGPSEDT